jgi:hypothetical protein
MHALKVPRPQFRPAPFWSINDYLDEKEVRRQVRGMRSAGFGGAFFHSRDGLGTRYFSSTWFKMVAAAIDEGKKCGFNIWLYDEDRHPSMQHHGTVPKLSPAFCQQRLARTDTLAPGERALAWFDVDPVALQYRQIEAKDKAQYKKQAFKIFSPRPWKKGWYHEAPSYVDLLNPRAIKNTLRLAYGPYARRFKKEFGKAVPGIFFDEPYLLDVARGDSYVWTTGFEKLFKDRHGYDILPRLPLLYYRGKGYQKLRHDYWQTVTERFVAATTKQVCDWGEKNRLPITGHYLCEDNLDGQITCAGAVMPHYAYLQIPGVDLLCRNARAVLTMKQVSSVADQFNRKKVMSELYAVSGHSISFAELKWIADLHLSLGVNFLVPHLALYSMKGRRKRDCPPTLSYHQPYWKDYSYFNDYLGRCGQMLSLGQPHTPTLVLHPVSTGWATYELFLKDRKENIRYCQHLDAVLEALLTAKRGLALGDETILARHARITPGGIRINRMEYAAIVIPPSLTWFSGTFKLLMKFTGKIIMIGQKPTCLDGAGSDQWHVLWQKKNVVFLPTPRPEALNRLLPGNLDVRDQAGRLVPRTYLHHRVAGKEHIYYLANNQPDRGFDLKIKFKGKLRELDLASGEIKEQPDAFLPPAGARCYIGTPGKGKTVWRKTKKTGQRALTGPYEFRRTTPNLLPLDFAAVSINNAEFSLELPLHQVRNRVLEHAGMHNKQDYQPWLLDMKQFPLPAKRDFALRYTFTIHNLPRTIALVLESADRYGVKVNGKRVYTKTNEWLIDRSFRRVEIASYIKLGTNTIELSARYELNTEVEGLYLAGDFGVRLIDQKPVIVDEPPRLVAGDWCGQGYPFYAGSMLYSQTVSMKPRKNRRYLIDLEGTAAAVCAVRVNGKQRHVVAWAPWQVDITSDLVDGENTVEIEVTSTLRNVMGPLHNKDRQATEVVVFDSAFTDEKNWTNAYQLVPYGLMQGARLKECLGGTL